ncbi:MAG: hypothetical protein U0640_13785 [Phycisphaerales bacterium]
MADTQGNPSWFLSCATCGKSKSLAKVGGVRLGAASKGKRVLGICSGCKKLRWLKLEKRVEK